MTVLPAGPRVEHLGAALAAVVEASREAHAAGGRAAQPDRDAAAAWSLDAADVLRRTPRSLFRQHRDLVGRRRGGGRPRGSAGGEVIADVGAEPVGVPAADDGDGRRRRGMMTGAGVGVGVGLPGFTSTPW